MPTHQLSVPDAVQDRQHDAIEIARLWIVEDAMHASLKLGMWSAAPGDEAVAWGIFVADLMRKLAAGIAGNGGLPPEESLRTIRKAMETELENARLISPDDTDDAGELA